MGHLAEKLVKSSRPTLFQKKEKDGAPEFGRMRRKDPRGQRKAEWGTRSVAG